jgi:hypothetical protein
MTDKDLYRLKNAVELARLDHNGINDLSYQQKIELIECLKDYEETISENARLHDRVESLEVGFQDEVENLKEEIEGLKDSIEDCLRRNTGNIEYMNTILESSSMNETKKLELIKTAISVTLVEKEFKEWIDCLNLLIDTIDRELI